MGGDRKEAAAPARELGVSIGGLRLGDLGRGSTWDAEIEAAVALANRTLRLVSVHVWSFKSG